MPFEHHLIEPEDAPLDDDGELLLDDSLVGLSNRLRSDALSLAGKYPPGGVSLKSSQADETPGSVAASSGSSRGISGSHTALGLAVLGLVGLASCLLVMMSSAWMDSPASRSSQQSRHEAPRDETTSHSPTAMADSVEPEVVLPSSGTVSDRSSWRHAKAEPSLPFDERMLTPVRLVPAVSGPELEGLLDLMEHQNAAEPRIEI